MIVTSSIWEPIFLSLVAFNSTQELDQSNEMIPSYIVKERFLGFKKIDKKLSVILYLMFEEGIKTVWCQTFSLVLYPSFFAAS